MWDKAVVLASWWEARMGLQKTNPSLRLKLGKYLPAKKKKKKLVTVGLAHLSFLNPAFQKDPKLVILQRRPPLISHP